MKMSHKQIRAAIIKSGVRNLKEYGYPGCNADNIVTDMIYRSFFLTALRSNLGSVAAADAVIVELIDECEAAIANDSR